MKSNNYIKDKFYTINLNQTRMLLSRSMYQARRLRGGGEV